jgi:hypothetical protein
VFLRYKYPLNQKFTDKEIHDVSSIHLPDKEIVNPIILWVWVHFVHPIM